MASMEDFATVIAGDVDGIESRVATAETTVRRVKGTNVTYGQGAPPAGSADDYPVGWWYRDMSTGDIYRVVES